jgi:hypothetical protein
VPERKWTRSTLTMADVHQQLALLLEHGYGELRIVVQHASIAYMTPMPLIKSQEELEGWQTATVDKHVTEC